MTAFPRASRLAIAFTGYWIAGSGQAGAGVDDVTWRDDLRCPAMPMTQIKGQPSAPRPDRRLGPSPAGISGPARKGRHGWAGRRRPRWSWQRGGRGRAPLAPRLHRADHDREAQLGDRRQIDAIALVVVGATRLQVAVPMTLTGEVVWRAAEDPALSDWVERLDRICAATLAFGKGKSDGLGRAIASCTRSTAP